MQLCRGCDDYCLNGGVCQAGPVSFVCICLNGFTGSDCSTEATFSCGAGTEPQSGVCRPCSPGTFSTDGTACVPCQIGTYSNLTAATASCPSCPSGSYAPLASSTSCTACSSCKTASSFAEDAYSPTAKTANQTTETTDNQITAASTPVTGWIYVGILAGFIILSTAILFPLRRQTRRYIAAVSVILKTPFSVFRVVPSSWTVVENPSFYRGLVALWVIAALILVTAYQSDVFAVEGITTDSSVQPGSLFTSKLPTASATTNVSLIIVLFQTPITCNSTQFSSHF